MKTEQRKWTETQSRLDFQLAELQKQFTNEKTAFNVKEADWKKKLEVLNSQAVQAGSQGKEAEQKTQKNFQNKVDQLESEKQALLLRRGCFKNKTRI